MPSTAADTPITYAADAYSPERAQQPRSEESRHSRRFRLVPPQELRKIKSQSYYRVRPEDRPTHPLRMDEECLHYPSDRKLGTAAGALAARHR